MSFEKGVPCLSPNLCQSRLQSCCLHHITIWRVLDSMDGLVRAKLIQVQPIDLSTFSPFFATGPYFSPKQLNNKKINIKGNLLSQETPLSRNSKRLMRSWYSNLSYRGSLDMAFGNASLQLQAAPAVQARNLTWGRWPTWKTPEASMLMEQCLKKLFASLECFFQKIVGLTIHHFWE